MVLADAAAILPVQVVTSLPAQREGARSFSAQLLELGLRHNVEGLVKKAQDQMEDIAQVGPSPMQRAHAHYENAQNNFSETRRLLRTRA
jgi:hypothetical protein